MTSQDLDQVKRKADFDRLMTAANVHRRRGDYVQAALSIKQALALAPENADAREFAADMLFAHGDLEKAAEQYKLLFEEDKSRTSAEQKYATAILQISEGKRQQGLLKEMLENPGKVSTPSRNPLYAAILSGFPGLGHIYCYAVTKGIILGAVTMFFWVMFWLFAPPAADYSGLSERVARSAATHTGYLRMSAPAVMSLCAAITTQVYAIVDAVVIAEKTRKNKDTEPA